MSVPMLLSREIVASQAGAAGLTFIALLNKWVTKVTCYFSL